MSSPHIHVPFNKVPEHLDFILEKRLNLEIYISSDVLDSVSLGQASRLKEDLRHDPSLSLHAPFMDLSPGAVDSMIREVTMARFMRVLSLSEVLEPKVIVFHSGYEKWKYALNVDLWLEKSLMTWRLVNEKASNLGVKVAIENIFEDEPANLKLLMENMCSPNFGICFDTGHFNLFSKEPLEHWMESLNPYILELHLHDNNKSSDEHLPIGDGSFDFDKFFSLLVNTDCVYTIEAHSPGHVMKSVEYLRSRRRS